MAHLGLKSAGRRADGRMSANARTAVFVVAAAIGAFDLGSYVYLKRQSVDFVVARRIADAPAYALGTKISWLGQSPGAIFGWARPEPLGTWSIAPAAALMVRLPARPIGDLVLVADVIPFVDARKLPERRVDVLANQTPVAQWRFDRRRIAERVARIPHDVVAADGVVRIDFRFTDLHSPLELGAGEDRRKLALLMVEWRLEAAAPY
jgi:hypothetical protein